MLNSLYDWEGVRTPCGTAQSGTTAHSTGGGFRFVLHLSLVRKRHHAGFSRFMSEPCIWHRRARILGCLGRA